LFCAIYRLCNFITRVLMRDIQLINLHSYRLTFFFTKLRHI
jgi:hypothetical protein